MIAQKGDLVETWFDTGCGHGSAMGGPVVLYGVVIASGSKTCRVRWRSGLTNRLRHSDYGLSFKPANDPEQARLEMNVVLGEPQFEVIEVAGYWRFRQDRKIVSTHDSQESAQAAMAIAKSKALLHYIKENE